MSFAYLPFYTGDYFRDTRGLSMAGHGCYFLFLTYCWDSKGPLPLDEEAIAGICNARSHEERLTMQRVVSTYFVRMADGWYNSRMQREIERCNAISNTRSEAGRRGANERMREFRLKSSKNKEILASAKHLPSKSLAFAEQVTPTSPPSPSLSTTTSKTKVRDASELPDWIPSESWQGYIEMRRLIRKPMTENAKKLAVGKLAALKADGNDPTAVLEASIFNSWQGLFPPKEWKRGNGAIEAWWTSEPATLAKQKELGLSSMAGESWQQLRARIAAKIRETAT
jgi:uncharacterized protein YdaU (DUF1376 family)